MPPSCFSYPADGPAGREDRDVVRPNLRDPRRMPYACFSYPRAVPPDIRNRDTARPGPDGHVTGACVSYPVMPCFRY